jgi:sulfite exporter TauE/SafE
MFLRRLLRILPWFALGPLTGSLGWRMSHNLEAKNRILAILYGLAIVTTSAALAMGAGRALAAWVE